MTEAQKMIFNTKIEEYFYTIEKVIKGETTKDYDSIYAWGKNLYTRYRYAINGDKPKYALPKEHLETLKRVLEYKNITEVEFKKSLGKIDLLAEILKEKRKKQIKNCSLEELEKLQKQYDEELISLEQKHTVRYRKLHSISDDEYNQMYKRIKEIRNKRKEINKLIEQKTKEKNETSQTENKQRKQTKYNEKITKLMKENKEKDEEIEKLKNKLNNQEQSRKKDILEYQGDYEKRLAEKTQQLEEEYKTNFERKSSMLELEYNRKIKETKEELEKQKQILEEYKKQQEKELDRQKRILTNQDKELKERQQKIIIKLLCSAHNISLETIKNHLEYEKIGVEGLENSLKELRNMIPGITRVLKEEGPAYSLRLDALKKLEDYKKEIVNPSISNIRDGKVEFVVRADLHLEMTNSEDTIKKKLEVYFNYCSANGNIPIVDLGDLAETLSPLKYKEWKEFNKEAARQSFKFYKNYAKAIASAPEINHYTLLGNHDEHPYLVGVDPIEILSEYSENFKPLGISKGSFKIGNDKIGVFHDKTWQNIVSYQEHIKEERDNLIYDYLCDEVETIASNYIYSLFGHYHFGIHNIEKSFSVINNGLSGGLIFTAELKDGHVEKMFVTELTNKSYKIEIYNRGNQYRK